MQEQEVVAYRQEEGVLKITNSRLLWQRSGEQLYVLNYSRLNLGKVQIAKAKEAQEHVLQLEVHGQPKPAYFRFKGDQSEARANAVKARLEERLQENQVAGVSLNTGQIE